MRVTSGYWSVFNKDVFVFALCGVFFAFCTPVEAQETRKVPRIGYLRLNENSVNDEAFRKGLREIGYVEGRNIQVEYRYSGGSLERLAAYAQELANLKVDVIIAASTQSIEAARRVTKTIPVVFPVTADPVASGFITSLARPGGNLTGLTTLNDQVAGKRVELLKEVMPRIAQLGVLRNPTNSGSVFALKETERTAKHFGLTLIILEVQNAGELESAFERAIKEQAGALLVVIDNVFASQRKRIAALGKRHRLPMMSGESADVEAGSLMYYGVHLPDLFRRSATYVDKILKGAKPADLPVERPTKFEFLINLETAKQIGLSIPPNVLARADRVIK
jgi:putative ABC transport system substrate-binding protein